MALMSPRPPLSPQCHLCSRVLFWRHHRLSVPKATITLMSPKFVSPPGATIVLMSPRPPSLNVPKVFVTSMPPLALCHFLVPPSPRCPQGHHQSMSPGPCVPSWCHHHPTVPRATTVTSVSPLLSCPLLVPPSPQCPQGHHHLNVPKIFVTSVPPLALCPCLVPPWPQCPQGHHCHLSVTVALVSSSGATIASVSPRPPSPRCPQSLCPLLVPPSPQCPQSLCHLNVTLGFVSLSGATITPVSPRPPPINVPKVCVPSWCHQHSMSPGPPLSPQCHLCSRVLFWCHHHLSVPKATITQCPQGLVSPPGATIAPLSPRPPLSP
nr:proline-rich receptor-like protein kinase PERK2 [Zonotrichia albicollis]